MKLTARSMENAAVHYLRRFPASSGHLRRVLWRKAKRAAGYEEAEPANVRELIEGAVTVMQRAGLVDDEAYARALVQSLHRQGKSRRAIKAKLYAKSVEPELTEEALAVLDEEVGDPELDAAWRLAAKKRLGPYRDEDEVRIEKRQRDLGVMARAGFGYDVARRVIDAETARDRP